MHSTFRSEDTEASVNYRSRCVCRVVLKLVKIRTNFKHFKIRKKIVENQHLHSATVGLTVIVIIVIILIKSKMAAAAILNFEKCQYLRADNGQQLQDGF